MYPISILPFSIIIIINSNNNNTNNNYPHACTLHSTLLEPKISACSHLFLRLSSDTARTVWGRYVRPRVSRPVNSRPTEQTRLAVGSCKYILRYVASSGVRVARISTHIMGKSILGTPANILRWGEKCQSARKLKWNKRESRHTNLVITRFLHTLIILTPVSEHTAPPSQLKLHMTQFPCTYLANYAHELCRL